MAGALYTHAAVPGQTGERVRTVCGRRQMPVDDSLFADAEDQCANCVRAIEQQERRQHRVTTTTGKRGT